MASCLRPVRFLAFAEPAALVKPSGFSQGGRPPPAGAFAFFYPKGAESSYTHQKELYLTTILKKQEFA